MNDFWLYLLKSGLSLWLFYGVYWFFLRKETFFSMNRFILLGSVIISLLLPALRFENLINLGTNRVVPSFFIELGDEPVKSSLPSTSNSGQHVLLMNWFLYLLIIYLAGIIILGMRLVYQATRLLLIRKKHELVLKDGMKLVFVDQDITPFSWWNIIFLNRSVEYTGELDKIIRHEKAHFRNMHFIDLLLVGFVALLQWFNPVMWFLERSIREIHEYEADREVLKWDTDKGKYQALLVNQMTGIELFRLGNGFSKSLTKKRMIMMTKIKSPKTALLKSLFILPVIAILTMAFGEKSQNLTQQDYPVVVKGVVTDAESSKPVEGAAIIIQGTTTGTISNQDGEYEIEIKEKGSVLVFSYVGYETQRVEVKKEVIDVAMKRANILLNFESGDKIMFRETSEKTLEGRQMEDVVVIVEEMPVFPVYPGGFVGIQDYLTKNMKYPDDAKKNEIEGKVYVQFTVDEKGKVTNAKIVKSVYPSLDKETLRLIYNMPDWNPGKQRGKPVPVMFTMPVVFKQD